MFSFGTGLCCYIFFKKMVYILPGVVRAHKIYSVLAIRVTFVFYDRSRIFFSVRKKLRDIKTSYASDKHKF